MFHRVRSELSWNLGTRTSFAIPSFPSLPSVQTPLCFPKVELVLVGLRRLVRALRAGQVELDQVQNVPKTLQKRELGQLCQLDQCCFSFVEKTAQLDLCDD